MLVGSSFASPHEVTAHLGCAGFAVRRGRTHGSSEGVVDGGAMDFEASCGFVLVALVVLEGVLEIPFFDLVHCPFGEQDLFGVGRGCGGGGSGGACAREEWGWRGTWRGVEGGIAASKQKLCDGAFEFADIAGPRVFSDLVAFEPLGDQVARVFEVDAGLGAKSPFIEETKGDRQDIFASLA